MRKLFILCFLVLFTGCVSQEARFQEGYEAYEAEDFDRAFFVFEFLAEEGNAKAQSYLGDMYNLGYGGVEIDYTTSLEWYRKSASQGNARGQFGVGFAYHYGYAVEQSYDEAVSWYMLAGLQGHMGALNNLGALYSLSEQHEESFKWYYLLAEQGSAKGMRIVGNKYYYGTGVEKNFSEAANWYRKSALEGDAEAQYNLGLLYDRGEGVPKNFKEALVLYRQSALQGYAAAQRLLAWEYYAPRAVSKNLIRAYMWASIANSNEAGIAKELFEALEKQMRNSHVLRAQKLAKKCFESDYQKCGE